MILIAVLVVIALGAMVAATLIFRMRAEVASASASDRGEQAMSAAMSGVNVARIVVRQYVNAQAGDSATAADAGDAQSWMDNPQVFQNKLVVDDGANRWYFTIYAEPDSDTTRVAGLSDTPEFRYGLTDENGLININYADRATLALLPGMSPELADAVLAYRGGGGASGATQTVVAAPSGGVSDPLGLNDSDSFTSSSSSSSSSSTSSSRSRESGASSQPAKKDEPIFESDSETAVVAKGPLSVLDELLQVPGFNATLIYGPDRHAPTSAAGDAMSSAAPSYGDNAPLRSLLTTFSYDRDVDSTGKARTNVNSAAEALEKLGLSEEMVRVIRLYRAEGYKFASPADLAELRFVLKADHKEYPQYKKGDEVDFKASAEDLTIVMDKLTASASGGKLHGVNVNTAPKAVLAAIPEIGPNLAEQIVGVRGTLDAEKRATVAWLFTQGAVEAAAFKQIAPKLTARSRQFRVRCVGFGWPSGRYRMIEAVIDAASGEPRVLYLRETTRLGAPMPLTPTDLGATGSR